MILICLKEKIVLIRMKTPIILRILPVVKCEPRNAKNPERQDFYLLALIVFHSAIVIFDVVCINKRDTEHDCVNFARFACRAQILRLKL